jgi:hypothetical protein
MHYGAAWRQETSGRRSTVKSKKAQAMRMSLVFILLRMLNRLEGPNFDIFTCIAWQIWFRRNKLVFEGFFTHPKKVAQIAKE